MDGEIGLASFAAKHLAIAIGRAPFAIKEKTVEVGGLFANLMIAMVLGHRDRIITKARRFLIYRVFANQPDVKPVFIIGVRPYNNMQRKPDINR